MARFLKIIGGLLVLLIAVALIIPFVVPADELKGQILTQMKAATGRDVTLGTVRVSIFPTLGLKAENVTISNPAWAGGGNLAEIKMLHLGVELIPLLHKKVDLTDLTLEDPVVSLIKKGGQSNWDMSGAKQTTPQAQTPAKKSTSASDPAASLESLSLGSISITGGNVSYKDYDAGTTEAITDVNLKLKAPNFNDKLSLDATATYQNNKLTLSFTMAKLLSALGGVPSDATLKFEFGPLAFTWEGSFTLKNGLPMLKGTLDIPEINAAKFKEFKDQTAGASPSHAAAPAAASSGHWSTAPIDLQALNSASADVALTIGKLVLSQTTLSDIKAHVALNAGKPGELLTITTEDIAAYSGTVQTTIAVTAPGTVNISASVDKVNAGKLLHDFAQTDSLVGTLATHVNLTASGHSEREMVDSLAGKGDFQVKDGEIKGVDLLSMAEGVTSAFTNSDKNTKFSNLSGTFVAKAGVITNNDLSLLSDIMRVDGAGNADLPNWRVNYLLKPILASAITVPIRIEGPLNSPSYRPDLKATLQENLKDPAAVQNAVKSLKGINSDSLKGLLR